MAKTVDGIDEEALEHARTVLGTANDQDTVNDALRQAVKAHQAAMYVVRMMDQEQDEAMRLADEAWRRSPIT